MIKRLLFRPIAFVFSDPVRPVEVLSVAFLAGWTLYLAQAPEILLRSTYSAFDALPASAWALMMIGIIVIQLLAMLPAVKIAETMRFVSMALAAGIWTIVAINFWRAAEWGTGTVVYSAIAVITALAGIWLGWASKKS